MDRDHILSLRHSRGPAATGLPRALVVLVAALLFAGCASDPWDRYPSTTPPDRQCRTGHEAGYDIYVWECVAGQRTAVFRYCSGMAGCRAPERQTGPCGAPTPIERDEAAHLDPCEPPPPGQRWR